MPKTLLRRFTSTSTPAVVTSPLGQRRLADALADLTDRPDRWDQSYWLTRTSDGWRACLAGTLVLRAGFRPYVDEVYGALAELFAHVEVPDVSSVLLALGDGVLFDDERDVWTAPVRAVACRLLDLDPTDPGPSPLFNALSTLAELWHHATVLTGGVVRPTDDQLRRALTVDRAHEAVA